MLKQIKIGLDEKLINKLEVECLEVGLSLTAYIRVLLNGFEVKGKKND